MFYLDCLEREFEQVRTFLLGLVSATFELTISKRLKIEVSLNVNISKFMKVEEKCMGFNWFVLIGKFRILPDKTVSISILLKDTPKSDS